MSEINAQIYVIYRRWTKCVCNIKFHHEVHLRCSETSQRTKLKPKFFRSSSDIPVLFQGFTTTAFFSNIAKIQPVLSLCDAETVIHAFVPSRLDYCKVLFSGFPHCATKGFQLA